MSRAAVRKALETALVALAPSYPTAWENMNFEPVEGTAYQRVTVLFAEPDNIEMDDSYIERGFMQVDLYGVQKGGPAACDAKGEAIRDAFRRGMTFLADSVTTHIERTPEITPGRNEDGRYVISVRVRFYAFISRS